MATMSFSSMAAPHSRKSELCSSIGLQKSPFLSGSTIFKAPLPQLTPRAAGRRTSGRCYAKKSPLDNIPKRFREENLEDGVAENFKNAPDCMYGLTPALINMFMTENSPLHRQAQKVTEESISSRRAYLDSGDMYSFSGRGAERLGMMNSKVSMFGFGERRRGRRSPPPDLPSLLLDNRIVYLGMPIVPSVAQLLLAEFVYLDYDDNTKPIYLYINSTGTQDEDDDIIGSDTDAYAIIDAMRSCASPVYTMNLGVAYGQAAMLLANGKKGKRGLQPHSRTKLYKPEGYGSSGASIDTWIDARELDVISDYYLRLLSEGIGKPKDEISRDIDHGRFFSAQQTIDYGIADKIMEPQVYKAYEPKNYDQLLAESKARNQKRQPRTAAAQPGW